MHAIKIIPSHLTMLRQMVKNAISWAKQHQLARTNPVHGAEEFRVPTLESFNAKEKELTKHRASAECEVEDRCVACQCRVCV